MHPASKCGSEPGRSRRGRGKNGRRSVAQQQQQRKMKCDEGIPESRMERERESDGSPPSYQEVVATPRVVVAAVATSSKGSRKVSNVLPAQQRRVDEQGGKSVWKQCPKKEKELIDLRKVNMTLNTVNECLREEIEKLKEERRGGLDENLKFLVHKKLKSTDEFSKSVIKHLREQLTKERTTFEEVTARIQLAEVNYEWLKDRLRGIMNLHLESITDKWEAFQWSNGNLVDLARMYESCGEAWNKEILKFMNESVGDEEDNKVLFDVKKTYAKMAVVSKKLVRALEKLSKTSRLQTSVFSVAEERVKMKQTNVFHTTSSDESSESEEDEGDNNAALAGNSKLTQTDELEAEKSVGVVAGSSSSSGEQMNPAPNQNKKTIILNIPKINISSDATRAKGTR